MGSKLNFLAFFLLSIVILVRIEEIKCSCKVTQTLSNSNTKKSLSLMFKSIGTYSGKAKDNQFYTKQYYIPNFFRVYWHEVKGICSQYGMEFATFETKEESEKILDILRQNGTTTQASWLYYFVGGVATVPESKTDWFWADSGEHIDYDLRWGSNQPNYGKEVEFCLTIGKKDLAYHDLPCDSYFPDPKLYNPQSFICQHKKVLCDVKN